jgi:hypothetical protein
MSAVILLERCEPMIQITPPAPTAPGECGTAHVTVTNLEPRDLVGSVSLRLPAGWTTTPQPLRLPCGKSADFTLDFTVAKDAKFDVADIYAVVRDGPRTTDKCVTMGVCRPVWAELHYVTRDQIKLEMTNNTAQPLGAVCDFTTPAGVTGDPAAAAFSLPAHGQAELLFHLTGVDSVTTLQHVKAVLSYPPSPAGRGGQGGEASAGGETSAYEVLQPPVLNGNFDQCTGGDNWPDYWNYRSPETLYLRGAALDPTVRFEGNQSLRIDPNPAQNENAVLTTFLRLIPNTKYRVSCAIKCADWKGLGLHLFSLGSVDPKRRVDVYLNGKPSDPVNTWQRFSTEFTSADVELPYEIGLSNWGKNTTPVWYAAVKIEEVK